MATDLWYYVQGSTATGPVDTLQLRQLIQTRQLPSAVLIARPGSSTWLPASDACPDTPFPAPSAGIVSTARKSIETFSGTSRLEGFSLGAMFSEVFRHRSPQEIDDYFIVGTYRTTPNLEDVSPDWPKPWFFWRVLVFFGSIYLALMLGYIQFGYITLVPGLMMSGALVIPLGMVFLFFELNILKNVSLLQVLMLMCVGGVLSIGISLAADSMSDLGWMGASAAGIVEETGKILAVFLILKKKPQNYILNGLLLGAAVGAGFAALESAGYIYLWRGDSTPAEFADIITIRAIGNLFGHIVWTAIAGAALLRAKGNREVRANLLLDPKFLTALSIPITLHMLWNSPLPNLFQLKTVVLGLVGWYVVFGMVQQGLTQVRLSKHALQSRHAMPV